MALIAGNQIIGAGSIGAFEEDVVIGVAGDAQRARRNDEMAAVPDELDELEAQIFSDTELGAGKNLRIFIKNGLRNVQPAWLGGCQGQRSALEAVGFEGGRDEYVGIQHEPERKHQADFFFPVRRAARVARMIWSITREVSWEVPFRFASSPMRRRTSGSGAASLT